MTKLKHTWRGLFYDYQRKTFWNPRIQRRESGTRRTTADGNACSVPVKRPSNMPDVLKVYAQESANPGLTGDLKAKINCQSLQFRFGCRLYDRSTTLSLFTYEVNHSYVILLICVPGSPGHAMRKFDLIKLGSITTICNDRDFITSHVTWIVHGIYPQQNSKICLVWQ